MLNLNIKQKLFGWVPGVRIYFEAIVTIKLKSIKKNLHPPKDMSI